MSSSDKDTSSNWTPPSVAELQAMLPQYEVEALWGRGGMGAVYKGRQKSLHRDVAIKVLPENFGAGDRDSDPHQFVERFKLEARSMANLDHPAILSVHDFGQTEQGQLYLVMEFVDGMDIFAYLQHHGGKLPDKHAIAICSHVLDALQYAHDSGVIHRDIKPSNVLINSQGRVKLADFGLAKRIAEEGKEEDSGAPMTMPNMAMGTPDYVAPETLDSNQEADGRADLYAVGVMLYELLTGKLPRGQFKSPAEMVPGLDVRFDEVISKALQTDPNDRYASATAFRSDLDKILSQPIPKAADPASAAIPVAKLAEEAAPASRPEPTPGASKPKPAEPEKSKAPLFVGIGLAAMLAVGGLVAFLVKDGESTSAIPEKGSNTVVEGGAKRPAKPPQPPAVAAADVESQPAAQQGRFAPPTPAAQTTSPKEGTPEEKPLPEKPPVPEPAPVKPVPAGPETVSPAPPAGPPATAPRKKPTEPPNPEPEEDHGAKIAELVALRKRFDELKVERIGILDANYLKAIEREINTAADAGNLDAVTALRVEKKRVTDEEPMPETDPAGTPKALTGLRRIYRPARAKEESTLLGQYQTALKQLETDLTKKRKFEDALVVKDFRESLVKKSETAIEKVAPMPKPAVPAPAIAANTAMATHLATKDKPFENSLDMKFVPVPITGGPTGGKLILFSIWETRIEDFEEFVSDEIPGKWVRYNTPEFKQEDDHPAVSLSWDEAVAFCEWLTEKERRRRKIGPKDRYRLPTDHEWSCAAGIGVKEDADAQPLEKNQKIPGFYWGEDFPPPPKTGNFNGEETEKNPIVNKVPIKGYSDDYGRTSPAGSFSPNEYGLFDLDGNVSEFCEEHPTKDDPKRRVFRGGSWYVEVETSYLISFRGSAEQSRRYQAYGFRMVLDTGIDVGATTPEAADKPTWSPAVIQAALEKKPGRLYAFGKTTSGAAIPMAAASKIDDFASVRVRSGQGWIALRKNGEIVVENNQDIKVFSRRIQRLGNGFFANNTYGIDSSEKLGIINIKGAIPVNSEMRLSKVSEVWASDPGLSSSLALTEDGTVRYWGPKYEKPGASSPPPHALTGVSAIATERDQCYVAKTGGSIIGWVPGGSALEVPQTIKNVKDLAAGYLFCLGLTQSGEVVGWGENLFGVLDVPKDLGECIAIRANSLVAAAQRKDGSWVAWGNTKGGVVEKISSLGPVTDVAISSTTSKNSDLGCFVLWIKADVK